jgi:P-type E1-E2 ATPase
MLSLSLFNYTEDVMAVRDRPIDFSDITGDRREIAEATAKELGVDEAQSELPPDQKFTHVRELRMRGRTVALIGDGVNDAPALMESNVGVAMGS